MSSLIKPYIYLFISYDYIFEADKKVVKSCGNYFLEC